MDRANDERPVDSQKQKEPSREVDAAAADVDDDVDGDNDVHRIVRTEMDEI